MSSLSSPPIHHDPRAVALLLAATLTTMANAAISPALPGLEARFADHPQAALLTRFLVSAPSVAVVLVAGWSGSLADRFGKRRMLLGGVGLFAVAGTAGFALATLEALLISRLILGIAVALIMTSQTALIADYFDGAARSRLLGLQVSARNIGGLVAIGLAGFLALISPMHAFAVHALALLILPVLWRSLPEPARTAPPTPAPDMAEPVARRFDTALWSMAGLQMLTVICFFTMPTQLPFFIAHHGIDNAAVMGGAMVALTLAGALAASRYSALKPRLGHARLLALGYALMGGGMLTLALAQGIEMIVAGAILVGLGFATVVPNFNEIALAATPPHRRGRTAGVLTTAVFLGQILSPLLTLPLLQAVGFTGMFATLAAVLILAALAGLALHLGRARRILPG
ncbi:MFS transporter [Roseovarius sp.]|uniref:MFS transporter n=1 Tax=Roseovarius sp. TaxID=1486281 RepID=UPI000C625EEC|nr:MFS transporter [Roseovarius sp.]MAZ20160.1 MFS transporter [Roseovarius sp.]